MEGEPWKTARQQLLTEAKAGHKSPINLKYILRCLPGSTSGPRNTYYAKSIAQSGYLPLWENSARSTPASHFSSISVGWALGFYYDIIFYCVPLDVRILGSSLHSSFNPFWGANFLVGPEWKAHRMCKFAWAVCCVLSPELLSCADSRGIGGVGWWPGSGFGFSAICAFDKGNKRSLWLLKPRRLLVDFVALFVQLEAIKYIQIYTGKCIFILFYSVLLLFVYLIFWASKHALAFSVSVCALWA